MGERFIVEERGEESAHCLVHSRKLDTIDGVFLFHNSRRAHTQLKNILNGWEVVRLACIHDLLEKTEGGERGW
jgi:hypothetical protein